MRTFLITSFALVACLLLSLIQPVESIAGTGDTTVVQTLRYDTTMRAGVFHFPDDTNLTYEKIIMVYGMRCKGGLVSTSTNRNQGCGEWDYNCYTSLIDSSQTDSLRIVQSRYVISGSGDTVFYYTTHPVYDYVTSIQQQVTYDSIISEIAAQPGNDTLAIAHPIGGPTTEHRSIYLWRASELSTSGLAAGPLTGLRLQVLAGSVNLSGLRVRMRATQDTLVTDRVPGVAGFTEVYFSNTTVPSTGILQFNFHTPFQWDGISNVLVDFSYSLSGGTSSDIVEGHDAGYVAGAYSDSIDYCLNLRANGNVLIADTSFLPSISNEITLAFWAYGDTGQLPANTSIAYGRDIANGRQLNIHLPWSDSKVYWDCGGSGGNYDRSSKAISSTDLKGRWVFWTFTKNASTGVMKMFMDGREWMSDTGRHRPIQLKDFWMGASPSGYQYRGNLDEFSVWNKALDSAAIASIMYHDIDPSHPDYQHLMAYYPLNEGSGAVAYDHSLSGANASIVNPVWRKRNGNELLRNFSTTSQRPDATFLQGTYVTSTQTVVTTDSILRNPTQIVEYGLANGAPVAIDSSYSWPASGYAYTYSDSGAVIDSMLIAPTDTLIAESFDYYQRRPMNFELIDFITPYGINLNMNGLNGRYWEFDVTDFAPVLRGDRYLAMNGAGRYSEENDIRFIYYEGTPPRNVRSITQVWPNANWTNASWSQIYNNQLFEPRTFTLDPGASMYKIRSAISGHGQEGEFIPRDHTLSIPGTVDFTRSVWTACATNPIYPQGGTWVYDRAGWCPGKNVDVAEYELTPYVTPGQQITLDYSMPYIANPGSSNYRVNNTLISYGPPNFTHDAAVYKIKSPSLRTEYMRFNPICDDPVILIRNTGADTLTSLDITYGRVGAATTTYHWTGQLPFMGVEEVVLPSPVWPGSPIDRFSVAVANPNGYADQYAPNDTMSTEIKIPDVYFGTIFLEYRPNNFVTENTYTVTDANGNVLLNRAPTVGGAIYRDTLNFLPGCYTIYMNDSGGDGLNFWANTNQGTGYFRLRSANGGTVLKTFQADFGDNVNYQFTLNYVLPVTGPVPANASVTLFPNPNTGRFTATIHGQRYSDVRFRIRDLSGREVYAEDFRLAQSDDNFLMDLDGVAPGIYLVQIEGEGIHDVQRIVIQ